MDQYWTDDAVSRLPLEGGRAALLEEIMNTDVDRDRPSITTLAPRHRRWLVPAAAAAAVVALAVGVVQLTGDDSPDPTPAPPVTQPPTQAPSAHLGLLGDSDWTLDDLSGSLTDGEGEAEFVRSALNVELSWGPEAVYADELDTGRSVDPASPDGAPVEVAGGPARLWSYSDADHLVLREVADGYWLAARGQGMSVADFRTLLQTVRLVDQATLESALPSEFVTAAERPEVIDAMTTGILERSGAYLPEGAALPTSEESTRYDIGADVAGGYACTWFEELVRAKRADDTQASLTAQQVLGTARTWPILIEMADEGDYPDTLWAIVDETADGTPPREWRQGIGC